MVEVNRRESSTIGNPMLLRIRQAALDKAFSQMRDKRFNLDEARSNGRITEDEYQQSLLNLIIEGNEIRNQQREVEEQLGR